MPDRRKSNDRRGPRRGEERRLGDRRESHRLPIDVEVRQGNAPFSSHQGNIGIGGVFFKTPLDLPTGALVQLRFTLPDNSEAIQAKGEVVEITAVGRPEDRGTRVRFIDLDIKNELAIARFLDDHAASK
ncbi:MAG: PilZ domain-containing protein [Deltaproteobacteria bacterium]|nr:MAG: PilZ domain-containing protein [Deltaproteobacteria bacterium]